MAKIALISLGCPKNRVDSDSLLMRLRREGMTLSESPDQSDIIIVNTCGFIGDAKRESIEEIVRCAGYKEGKTRKKLIVFGCLSERYGLQLQNEIPEIDALFGVGCEESIVKYCRDSMPDQQRSRISSSRNIRYELLSSSTPSYAYLKIAEGCDRRCAYCVIPSIRGGYKSRPYEDILREAEAFLKRGVKELILVGQDITSYGKDLQGYGLQNLIEEIGRLDGDFWIRLLYLHPAAIRKPLLETMAATDKVCKYVDMPLQHSEERVLRAMKRPGNREKFLSLIRSMRSLMPDVAIRTTLMVGYPGETEDDFRGMVEFVREAQFDRLGVFRYSREEGTGAFSLPGQVPGKVKNERYDRIMRIQSDISFGKNKNLAGKAFRALVDEQTGGVAIARLSSQAPEIDGVVFVRNADVPAGSFINVRIEKAYDYDLEGICI